MDPSGFLVSRLTKDTVALWSAHVICAGLSAVNSAKYTFFEREEIVAGVEVKTLLLTVISLVPQRPGSRDLYFGSPYPGSAMYAAGPNQVWIMTTEPNGSVQAITMALQPSEYPSVEAYLALCHEQGFIESPVIMEAQYKLLGRMHGLVGPGHGGRGRGGRGGGHGGGGRGGGGHGGGGRGGGDGGGGRGGGHGGGGRGGGHGGGGRGGGHGGGGGGRGGGGHGEGGHGGH